MTDKRMKNLIPAIIVTPPSPAPGTSDGGKLTIGQDSTQTSTFLVPPPEVMGRRKYALPARTITLMEMKDVKQLKQKL